MKNFIQITRHPYEEPYQLNLVIIAGNGLTQGILEFYVNTNCLREIGTSLSEFPSHDESRYIFTRGSECAEDRRAWFFRLHAKALSSPTFCALQLRFNNNRPPMNYPSKLETPQLVDFYIRTTSKKVRELGNLFLGFSELNHLRLFWNDKIGLLDNKPDQVRGDHAIPSNQPLNLAVNCLPDD